MLYEDVRDLADVLEYTGRTAPAAEWVDAFREAASTASLEDLL